MAGVYSAGDFRNGTTFEMEGNVYRVVEFQHVKPGKGSAFVRTKLKNVITGATIEKTFNPSDKFPGAEIEKKTMQYLYNDGGLYYFMDNETYDQLPLNEEQLGDCLKYLKENMEVTILSYKGKVFAVEPPTFVELEVTYTEPGFAGNTTTTSGKPATLENGAYTKGIVSVPDSTKTEERQSLMRKFKEFFGGRNSGGTMVLPESIKYNPISLSPADLDVLKSSEFSIREIARLLKVPPHMIGDTSTSTYGNLEQSNLHFLQYCLLSYIRQIEEVLNHFLLLESEKNGKYLLVQEAKKKCYKKWNFPAGHLDFNESLEQGAIREIKEETGCDVELNGVCYIANRILEDDLFVMIVFNAKLIKENIEYDKEEILNVKWFDYDEIVNKMDDKLRGSYVKKAVYNKNNKLIAPIEIVNILND